MLNATGHATTCHLEFKMSWAIGDDFWAAIDDISLPFYETGPLNSRFYRRCARVEKDISAAFSAQILSHTKYQKASLVLQWLDKMVTIITLKVLPGLDTWWYAVTSLLATHKKRNGFTIHYGHAERGARQIMTFYAFLFDFSARKNESTLAIEARMRKQIADVPLLHTLRFCVAQKAHELRLRPGRLYMVTKILSCNTPEEMKRLSELIIYSASFPRAERISVWSSATLAYVALPGSPSKPVVLEHLKKANTIGATQHWDIFPAVLNSTAGRRW